MLQRRLLRERHVRRRDGLLWRGGRNVRERFVWHRYRRRSVRRRRRRRRRAVLSRWRVYGAEPDVQRRDELHGVRLGGSALLPRRHVHDWELPRRHVPIGRPVKRIG